MAAINLVNALRAKTRRAVDGDNIYDDDYAWGTYKVGLVYRLHAQDLSTKHTQVINRRRHVAACGGMWRHVAACDAGYQSEFEVVLGGSYERVVRL